MFDAFGVLASLLWGLQTTPPTVAARALDPAAMLRAADASRDAFREGIIRVRAAALGKRRSASPSLLDLYVQGSDRVLCVFREGKQRGRKILSVGDHVWLLVPGAARPIPVSARERLMGGSTVADIGWMKFGEHYTATLGHGDEEVAGVRCHVLDITARSSKVPYASGVLWVGVEDGLPRRVRLKLVSGKEAKEILFVAYGNEDGKPLLKRMEVVDLLTSAHGVSTTFEFLRYDAKSLDPSIFSPAGAKALP